MLDLKISDMHKMQKEIWNKNKDKWEPLKPECSRNSILWVIEELGEVVSIIKKRGEYKIMNDPALRKEFVTELTDVYMYLSDVLLRYNISPEEFSNVYLSKHKINMERNFEDEYSNYLKSNSTPLKVANTPGD
jgi:NTP pyrophosphatase (non-canonical NTP hydrolase)